MSDLVKIPNAKGPNGEELLGEVVSIEGSYERYSDIELADGSVIRIKANPTRVIRVQGHWDNDGNPLYVVSHQAILLVKSAPDSLKKPRN